MKTKSLNFKADQAACPNDPGGGAQKESAAPAGPRNGAKKQKKPATASGDVYAPPLKGLQRILFRLDRLSREVDLGGLEMVPQPILDCIAIADELSGDPDFEDGHDREQCDDDVSVDDGFEDAKIAPRPRGIVSNYSAQENDRDPPVSYFAWGFTPKGEPGICFQPPRPNPAHQIRGIGENRERKDVAKPGLGTPSPKLASGTDFYSDLSKSPPQQQVPIQKIGTPARDGKGGGHG